MKIHSGFFIERTYFYNPNKPGSHSVSSGTSVITSNPRIMARKKGNRGRNTLAILVLATPTPINNTEPTGGVQMPIHRFNTIMIPKCTGSMPSVTTAGRNIGVKISTAGVNVLKVPNKNQQDQLIMIRITNLLSLSA